MAVRVNQPGMIRGTPAVGDPVIAGQTLFESANGRGGSRPAERIRGEIESIRRTTAALHAEIAELDALKTALSRHYDDYRDARIAQAENQVAEQLARVNAAAARLKAADSERRLRRPQSNRGLTSNVELARAKNAFVEATDELEVARQAAARQQLQLDAARRAFFVGEADGGQHRVASRQRCDEIAIQQAGLRARLAELDGQPREYDARLAGEERYLAGCRVRIVAPISGVIWSSSIAAGGEVSAGATALEIIDPSRSGIEAVFRDADAERLRPGDASQGAPARFRPGPHRASRPPGRPRVDRPWDRRSRRPRPVVAPDVPGDHPPG